MSEHDIDIYRDDNGEFRWRLVARNGEVVAASSEGFTRKWSAKRNAKAVRRRLDADL